MATITLTVQDCLDSGLTPTRTGSLSTANTYRFANDGNTMLSFAKSGAGACTVSITTPATVGGLAVAEQSFSVPAATGDVFAGPFPANLYNDEDGYASFTLSDILGLTVAVVRV